MARANGARASQSFIVQTSLAKGLGWGGWIHFQLSSLFRQWRESSRGFLAGSQHYSEMEGTVRHRNVAHSEVVCLLTRSVSAGGPRSRFGLVEEGSATASYTNDRF